MPELQTVSPQERLQAGPGKVSDDQNAVCPMTRIHRMNLKGPWDYKWLDGPHADGPGAEPQDEPTGSEFLLAHERVRMPSSIQDAWGAVSGLIRFQRRFQTPTNLEEHERVHVAFDGLGGRAAIELNGIGLAALRDMDSSHSFDITDRIEATNVLVVELAWQAAESGHQRGGLWGPVAIEIHTAPDGEVNV